MITLIHSVLDHFGFYENFLSPTALKLCPLGYDRLGIVISNPHCHQGSGADSLTSLLKQCAQRPGVLPSGLKS